MKVERIKIGEYEPMLPFGAREMRRFERRPIKATGSVRFAQRRYIVKLQDLSEQGCQVWHTRSGGMPAGATLNLYIEGMGPFEAIVRWSREGWAGLQFDMPVYAPILSHLYARLDRTPVVKKADCDC